MSKTQGRVFDCDSYAGDGNLLAALAPEDDVDILVEALKECYDASLVTPASSQTDTTFRERVLANSLDYISKVAKKALKDTDNQ